MNRLPIDPVEFLRRLLSVSSPGWRERLPVGSPVRLKRQALLLPVIPVGAPGRIVRRDEVMAERGCPFEVEFDLGSYGLKQCDFMPEDVLHKFGIDPNTPLTHLRTYLGPDDLEAAP